jgi:tetratricopeptide (TPR) repeat protein
LTWFTIAGMNHQWAAMIERLAELDRSQAFDELDVALKALPDDVPDGHRAAVAHWRGKVALLTSAIAEAIPQLALAASLDMDRAANGYLLGAALVRQQQWLDARTCLERAVQLQPGLASARLELATAVAAAAAKLQSRTNRQTCSD